MLEAKARGTKAPVLLRVFFSVSDVLGLVGLVGGPLSWMFSDRSDKSDWSEVLSCIFRLFAAGSLPKANRALGGRKREKGVFFSLRRRFSDWSDPSEWSERSDGRRFFEGKEVRICFSEGEMGLKNKEKAEKQVAAEHSPSWGRWRGLCRVGAEVFFSSNWK